MIYIKEVFCSSIDVEKMPKLGFGLMRLPMKEEEIDIGVVSRMVDEYMSAGLKYFDTAYVYSSSLNRRRK